MQEEKTEIRSVKLRALVVNGDALTSLLTRTNAFAGADARPRLYLSQNSARRLLSESRDIEIRQSLANF